MDPREDHPARRFARAVLRLAVIGLCIWALIRAGEVSTERVAHLPEGLRGPFAIGALGLALAFYAVLLALPFVPGVEVGIMLLAMKGAAIAPFVYAATCVGLMLAYLSGRYMPLEWLERLASDLRLARLAHLLDTLRPLSPEQRVAMLRRRVPGKLGDLLVRSRYVALALLVALPGNGVIGGGGGICLVAGLSRLFSTRGVFLAIALGVAPVPLAVWLFGWQVGGSGAPVSP